MGEKIDVPALLAKKGEVGDGRLAARQDDEIRDRQRLAGRDEDEPHRGLEPQRIEIVEIGDAREHRHGDRERRFARAAFAFAEAEGVLRRQARGGGEERREAEGAPAGALGDASSCRPRTGSRRRETC